MEPVLLVGSRQEPTDKGALTRCRHTLRDRNRRRAPPPAVFDSGQNLDMQLLGSKRHGKEPPTLLVRAAGSTDPSRGRNTHDGSRSRGQSSPSSACLLELVQVFFSAVSLDRDVRVYGRLLLLRGLQHAGLSLKVASMGRSWIGRGWVRVDAVEVTLLLLRARNGHEKDGVRGSSPTNGRRAQVHRVPTNAVCMCGATCVYLDSYGRSRAKAVGSCLPPRPALLGPQCTSGERSVHLLHRSQASVGVVTSLQQNHRQPDAAPPS